ncbi:hypothetical protein D3C80_1618400 [compost metagenome]
MNSCDRIDSFLYRTANDMIEMPLLNQCLRIYVIRYQHDIVSADMVFGDDFDDFLYVMPG